MPRQPWCWPAPDCVKPDEPCSLDTVFPFRKRLACTSTCRLVRKSAAMTVAATRPTLFDNLCVSLACVYARVMLRVQAFFRFRIDVPLLSLRQPCHGLLA